MCAVGNKQAHAHKSEAKPKQIKAQKFQGSITFLKKKKDTFNLAFLHFKWQDGKLNKCYYCFSWEQVDTFNFEIEYDIGMVSYLLGSGSVSTLERLKG